MGSQVIKPTTQQSCMANCQLAVGQTASASE